MRLHRFYIDAPIGANQQLTTNNQQLLHQWRNVFRMKSGPTSPRLHGARDRVVLFDGSGDDFVCEIIALGKNEAEVKIIEKKKGIIPDRDVWLFFSLIKKDNVELVLQKCTELGVSHFVPIISERSEKKGLNTDRAQKILIEASEQCGRSDIPKLHEVISLEEAIKNYSNKASLIAFDSSGISYNLQPTTYPLGLLIGPEGGWGENELDLFKQNNISVYSLGRLTLRAETAAMVASSLVVK